MLGQRLPLSDDAALSSAQALLELYRQALAAADEARARARFPRCAPAACFFFPAAPRWRAWSSPPLVTRCGANGSILTDLCDQVRALADEVGPQAVAAAGGAAAEVQAALAGTSVMAAAMAEQAERARGLDAAAVRARVDAVRTLVKAAAADERFQELRAVALLLKKAQDSAAAALAAAEALTGALGAFAAADGAFQLQLAEATEGASAGMAADVAEVERLAARVDAKQVNPAKDAPSWGGGGLLVGTGPPRWEFWPALVVSNAASCPSQVSLVANQAALRLELALVESLRRRCQRTQRAVAPVLSRLRGRAAAFKGETAPQLEALAKAARLALDKVSEQQASLGAALETAEAIVAPGTGQCEVVWLEEEVRWDGVWGGGSGNVLGPAAAAIAAGVPRETLVRGLRGAVILSLTTAPPPPPAAQVKVLEGIAIEECRKSANAALAAAAGSPEAVAALSALSAHETEVLRAKFAEAVELAAMSGSTPAARKAYLSAELDAKAFKVRGSRGPSKGARASARTIGAALVRVTPAHGSCLLSGDPPSSSTIRPPSASCATRRVRRAAACSSRLPAMAKVRCPPRPPSRQPGPWPTGDRGPLTPTTCFASTPPSRWGTCARGGCAPCVLSHGRRAKQCRARPLCTTTRSMLCEPLGLQYHPPSPRRPAVQVGGIEGLSTPTKSFALLVNCRRRRPGWRAVGEELLRRSPRAMKRTNQAGVTALAAACHAGHLDVAQWCIERGADINKGNMDGVTPVATAAARGHLGVVRVLTEAGADVSTGNADGDSVVAIACWEDHHDIVRYLGGRKGLSLDSRNLDGITPLEVRQPQDKPSPNPNPDLRSR